MSPKAGERERLAVGEINEPRVFLLIVGLRQLVKSVSRYEATLALERLPEGRLLVGVLVSGVEHGELGHLLCSKRNEPPSAFVHELMAFLTEMDKQDVLRWRDVVPGWRIATAISLAEEAVHRVDFFPRAHEGVASAHGEI